MRERPILLNSEMVKAVLDGRKTQTRRAVKFPFRDKSFGCELSGNELAGEIAAGNYRNCPFGQPADRLWVRETFGDCGVRLVYRADSDDGAACMVKRWTPSIHMPRDASRITLEITGVRLERLQDISEADAKAEGLAEITKDGGLFKFGIPDRDGYPGTDDKGWPWHEWERNPVDAYCKLWQSIYGAESWQANPWVWAIEFRRVEVSGE